MLQDLLDENIKWVDKQKALDPEYFEKLSKGQEPEIMLVGCCDSRFPFEVITNSISGDIFVHRNIANQVNPIDEDVISSIEFAVKVLEVKHIVVCGHYECGGVKAGMEHVDLPHVNSHIDSVKELFDKSKSDLSELSEVDKYKKMVELNVEIQCGNLSNLDFVKEATESKQFPHIHGWVLDLSSGLIKNLNVNDYS